VLKEKPLSMVDVSLFLEFGSVKMAPRPWLYPAWDATKHRLPEEVRTAYEEISVSGSPTAIRNSLGGFIPQGPLKVS
jgi:hypothetical protein